MTTKTQKTNTYTCTECKAIIRFTTLMEALEHDIKSAIPQLLIDEGLCYRCYLAKWSGVK